MNKIAHVEAPFQRMLGLVRPESRGFAVAVVYSIALGLLSLVLPVTIQALVNTVAFGSVQQPIFVLTLIVSAALAATAFLYTMRAAVLEIVQRRIMVRQASRVLGSLLRFRMDHLDPHHAPELVNRFLDVATVQKSAAMLAVDGLTVVMQTLAGVFLLAAYHPYLLVFDIALILAIVFVLFVLGRGAVGSSIEESRGKYEILAWLEEVARQSPALRSADGIRMAESRANALMESYLDRRARHFRIVLRQIAGAQLIQGAALAGLLGIGAHLVIAGELTLGQLVAAELVVSLAVGSFAKLGKSLEAYYDLQAALDKLAHLTELPVERTGGEQISGAGPAAIRGTGLAIGSRDVDFEASAGARVAITGPSASGKSTLMDLVAAIRDPESGSVWFDGVDYRHLNLESLRGQIFLVRGVEILPGTVAENVAMGLNVSPAAIRAALEHAGLLDAVNALPEGIGTVLDPSARPLRVRQCAWPSRARYCAGRGHCSWTKRSIASTISPPGENSSRRCSMHKPPGR